MDPAQNAAAGGAAQTGGDAAAQAAEFEKIIGAMSQGMMSIFIEEMQQATSEDV